MTDYTADQIGQMASAPVGAGPDEAASAAVATTGLGVTEADIEAIQARLASFERQLKAQAAAQAKATPDDITGSVASLEWYLRHHGDEEAQALGADAAEAAKSVAAGGNTGALRGIAVKLAAHLEAHPPAPGDQHHYRGALGTAKHLPVILDRAESARDGEAAPGKVVAGSVVG